MGFRRPSYRVGAVMTGQHIRDLVPRHCVSARSVRFTGQVSQTLQELLLTQQSPVVGSQNEAFFVVRDLCCRHFG